MVKQPECDPRNGSGLPARCRFCQMGTIGVEETREAVDLLASLRPSMVYLDAPVSGTKNRRRMRKFWCLPAGIVSEA
jgi:3-hydroxyisobutyrate dehydrogenase-like beta-hydroxyacid dehydrogenase